MATLVQIRERLVETSGRYDLVVNAAGADYSQNSTGIKINDIINEAQRWLDRLLSYPKAPRWLFKTIAANESLITFDKARWIREVWVVNSDGRTYVPRAASLRQLFDEYGDPFSTLTTGEPLKWFPYVTALAPYHSWGTVTGITLSGSSVVSITMTAHPFVTGDQVIFDSVGGTTELNGNTYTVTKTTANAFTLNGTDSSDFTAWTSGGTATKWDEDLLDNDFDSYGATFATKSIILMPPADEQYTVRILADWKTPDLSNDGDQSFWSVEEPGLLVRAAMLQLEYDYHLNSQRAADLERALLPDMRRIYHELVAEDTQGPPEYYVMQG